MKIYSYNNKGKRQYVAHFAQEQTGQRFLEQMNNIYRGHLTFKAEE